MYYSTATLPSAMARFFVFVFLTVAADCTMLVRACPQQGGACFCDSATRSVTCSRLGSLTRRLPLGIPANTKVLTVNHSTLSRLGPTAFRSCYQLEMVDLSENRLDDISQLAFQSLSRMVSLNLSNNRLRVLTEDTFAHLGRLEYLDLSRNRLIVLTPHNFEHLHNLRELRLLKNPTMCIAPSAFRGMTKLNVLEMSEMVSTLNEGLFRDLGRLERLVLRAFTEITEIPATLLETNNMLSELRIENFPKLANKGIPHTLLTGLSKLRILTLKACNLVTVPKQLLDRVKWSIMDLDLSKNLIKQVKMSDFKNLYNLRSLNLRRTGLKLIEPKSLDLKKLVNIDLFGNNLSVLNESVFGKAVETLQNVTLGNNPWVCDCQLRWVIRNDFVRATDRPVVCARPPWMLGFDIRSPVIPTSIGKDFFLCKGANITDFGIGTFRENSMSLGTSTAPVSLKAICKSSGYPKPQVRWILPQANSFNGIGRQRNSENLEKSALDRLGSSVSCLLCNSPSKHPTVGIQVSNEGTLQLHLVEPNLAVGVYTCRSVNKFGISERSFVITKEDAPRENTVNIPENRQGKRSGMLENRDNYEFGRMNTISHLEQKSMYDDLPTMPLLSREREGHKKENDIHACQPLESSPLCGTFSEDTFSYEDYSAKLSDIQLAVGSSWKSIEPSSSRSRNLPSVKGTRRNGSVVLGVTYLGLIMNVGLCILTILVYT